jgi:hypothetical protein
LNRRRHIILHFADSGSLVRRDRITGQFQL